MSDKQDKNIEAMAKLISLTRDGKLVWESVGPDTVFPRKEGDNIDSVFTAEYNGKNLRIYHRDYQRYLGLQTTLVRAMSGADADGMMSVSEVVLELTDNEGRSLWAFPSEGILGDFLRVIQYKVSGAGDLINELLDEK